MDCAKYIFILFALMSNMVFSTIVLPGQQVCYSYVGCFGGLSLFTADLLVPDSPASVGTQFQYFKYSTPENSPIILDYTNNSTLAAFDNSMIKTFFIIHGYGGSSMDPASVTTRRAIFKKFQNVNVIMVDWQNGAATQETAQTDINSQLVGCQTAYTIYLLTVLKYLNVATVHLIGHSLGAQACGFAGKCLQTISNSILGRISALDAAGLFFQLQNTSYHLTKTDASFVDAIHTFAGELPIVGFYGYLPPFAHVDFYPNGGRLQPCTVADLIYLINNPGSYSYILDDVTCSHGASVAYFAESIANNCPFTSTPCPGISSNVLTPFALFWGKFVCNSCRGNNCGRMGYYSDLAPGRGEQFLVTNDVSPYCKN